METGETDLEQKKQLDLKAKVEGLRAKGKTYREIAKRAHVSIAQISRILKQPNQQLEEVPLTEEQPGETAAKIFELLEKGVSLPNIVIQLKKEPKIVQDTYKEWAESKRMDVNQPNLGRLDSVLKSHILSHSALNSLLEQANSVGGFRKANCGQVDSNGLCKYWNYSKQHDFLFLKAQALRCAFCNGFVDNRH